MRTFPLYRHGGLSPFFVVLELGAYGGMVRKPTVPNLFRTTSGAEAIRTFAESSAHHGKTAASYDHGGKVFDASVPFQVAWVY